MKRSNFFVPLVLAGALAAIDYLVTIVPVSVHGEQGEHSDSMFVINL